MGKESFTRSKRFHRYSAPAEPSYCPARIFAYSCGLTRRGRLEVAAAAEGFRSTGALRWIPFVMGLSPTTGADSPEQPTKTKPKSKTLYFIEI